MGAFNIAVITDKGNELLAKAVSGKTNLEFTHIKISESVLSGDLASLTSIGTIKQAEKVASVVRQNKYTVKVSASFSNANLTAGYYIRAIGLYAKDPTEGEILYSISVADESNAPADWMPPFNSVGVSSLMVDLITAVSNSSDVSIAVDPTATATVAQILEVKEHLTALDNTITTTTNHTLSGSVAGGIKLNKVYGNCEQDEKPIPNVPQEIKGVVVSEIKATGKNLSKIIATNQTVNGLTFTVNDDGGVTVNGISSEMVLVPLGEAIITKGVTYVISGCPINGGDASYRIDLRNAEDNAYLTQEIGLGKSFEADVSRRVRLCARIAGEQEITNLTFYPMLRYADVIDNTYEPYIDNAVTLSQPITLNGIGGVADAVVERSGVFGVERAMDVLHTDDKSIDASKVTDLADGLKWGVSVWIKPSKLTGSNYNASNFIMSNKFTVVSAREELLESTGTCVSAYGHADMLEIRFRFLKTEYPTAEDVIEVLSGTEVYYPATNSTFNPLPVADQIALRSLVGYDGVTCLITNSEVEPTIEADYGINKAGAHTLTGLLTAQRNELKLNQL